MIKVVVIDDDVAVRDNLVVFLEDDGFEVFAASDGAQTLALIERYHPNLVIVDIRLPVIDGNELISQIYRMDPQIHFLIHTGSLDYAIPDGLREIGIVLADVFIKPVEDMSDFSQAIRNKVLGA